MSAAAGCVPAAARPTASAPGSLRSGLMSMIRARARALGVDPDRMRELMLRATGKESCGGMSADELGRVLTELNRTRGMRLRLPAGPHTARLRALWLSAWHLGVVPDRSDAALMRFAKRVSGFDAARPERGAEKAVEAIKAWLARAAKVDWRPYAAVDADGRRCEIHHPRARVLEAQWRILAGLGEVEIADRQALSSYAARHARIAARISHTQLGADAADALIRHFGRRIRAARRRQTAS